MRITPLDVRKQEFRKAVRGFDADEVRAFLGTLADEYEAVLVDNKVLRERLTEQEEKLGEYTTLEKTLRDTLMTAERVMQDTKENANREGHLVIEEAQLKARGILEECRIRTEELRREMISLRQEKETYLARFRTLAEGQIKFIDTHKDDFKDLDARLIEMADTVLQGQTGPISTRKSEISQPATSLGKDASEDRWRDYTTTMTTSPTAETLEEDRAVPTADIQEIPKQDSIAAVADGEGIEETTEAMAHAVSEVVNEANETECANVVS